MRFAKRLPGYAQIRGGSVSWETNFFPGPETFRNGSPTLISTIPEVFSKIQRFSSWEIGQKPHFRPFWGPNLGKDILGKRQVFSFSIINRNQKNLVMVMDWQSWLHRTRKRAQRSQNPNDIPFDITKMNIFIDFFSGFFRIYRELFGIFRLLPLNEEIRKIRSNLGELEEKRKRP